MGYVGGCVLDGMVWEGLSEEVTFELRSEGRKSQPWEALGRVCQEEEPAGHRCGGGTLQAGGRGAWSAVTRRIAKVGR